MGFTFEPDSLKFLGGFIFAILALIFGYFKHKKLHYSLLGYATIGYFLGLTIYPALSIIWFSAQKKTLFNEPLEVYRDIIGIAGILLIVVAVVGMYFMLRKNGEG